MADDYIVIPSVDDDKTTPNTAQEAEKEDSAARDDGKGSAKQTVRGAADSGPRVDGKNSANTMDKIGCRTVGSCSGKGANTFSETETKPKQLILGSLGLMLAFSPIIFVLVSLAIAEKQVNAKGPQFQIHSASASTMSNSWWSERIIADWNVSLGVKNLHSRRKFSYDFVQVSVFYGDTQLSTTLLTPFRQVAYDQLLLNVNFPAKIDASVSYSIKKAKKLNNTMSINVVITAKISCDNARTRDDWNWSKSLIASCKNIELQFSPDGQKAEMIAEEPVICE